MPSRPLLAKFAFAVASLAPCVAPLAMGSPAISAKSPAELALPAPLRQSRLSLEEALAQRRSLRSFAATHLTLAEVGQLLWAAQGISDAQGRRTAPSAGASYPLTLYLVAGRIDGLHSGVHRYLPQGHKLVMVTGGDVRDAVATAALDQQWLRDAPALIVIAAQPARTAARYGARAEHYVAIEAGAAAQNILLQAVALGLGATLVGAFDAAALRHSVPVVAGEQLLVIVPVGHAR